MKKLLSVLVVLALVLALIPAGLFTVSAEQSGDYTYTVINSKAKITDYTGSGTVITIPDSLGGYPVTAIGIYAFSYCNTLTSVTVPDSVIEIQNYAFYQSAKITTISLGAGVNILGYSVFARCYKLTQINAAGTNNAYSSSGGVLFNKTGETLVQYPPGKTGSYTMPVGVTSIAANAFYDCDYLTSVSVGSAVNLIGNLAFSSCSVLTQINVDPVNTAYSSLDGVLFDFAKTILIQYPSGKSGSCTVPAGVLTVANEAFSTCSGLTAVNLPAGLTAIGSSAYYYCSGLTSLVIPDSVTQIGASAFSVCRNLEVLNLGTGVQSIGANAFNSCTKVASLVIPDSVISIGDYAFSTCDLLATVSIGSGLASLGESVFAYCKNIAQFTLSSSNTAFSSPGGILFDKEQKILIQYPAAKSGAYVVPDGVETLAKLSFCNSGDLPYIDIPESVTQIGDYAFRYCQKLSLAVIRNASAVFGNNVFEACELLKIAGFEPSAAKTYAETNSIPFIPLATGILVARLPDKTMYQKGEPLDTTGMEVMAIDDGLNIDVVTTYTVTGYDADTYGRQNVTVMFNGYSVGFEVTVCVLSSAHPYQLNSDQSWTFINPIPCTMLMIEFSNLTSVEDGSDFIYIYDSENNLSGTYTGAELQGESIVVNGNAFTIRLVSDNSVPDYGFDILSVTGITTVISSPHPYENNSDENWNYTHPEPANKLKLTFSPQSIVENGYDFIYIYDSNDDLVGTYTGDMLAGRSIVVDGDSFRIRLTSDSSETDYGFDIIQVESFNSVISSDHPYHDDVDISWHYEHPTTVTYLELTFSPETSLEDGYDYVFIYDENNNIAATGTGLEFAGATITVIGSSFTVQLTSDGSQTDYGFDILTVTGFGTGGLLLTPAEGSGCIVDQVNGLLYGLAPGINSLDDYAEVPAGYRVEYGLSLLGTGSYVDVINDLTDEIVESYMVILFGDINGDGTIDSLDAGTAVDVENYQVLLDPVEDAAYRIAADINGDGTIDSLDAGLMVDFENYAIGINQSTGLYYTL